ncbi:GSCOCG00012674001-RA-CDS [Cotesia congregata]|nr:GSCOCG00012674001-RA-CDS [Cotesia congregata]
MLATAKTEVVVLTAQKWFPNPFQTQVVDQHIESRRALKYLGVTIDSKLTFRDQIVSVATRAATTVANLSRLMPNVGGPRSSCRRALMGVANSIVLYGVEIWGEALKVEKYRKQLASVQRRGALRIACAYRTVSEAAVLVISGVTPIDLLGHERKRIWDARRAGEGPLKDVRTREREETFALWQERWETGETGRWTYRLIGQIRDWVLRDCGEVDYYLTQFLAGHGQFNAYLHRMGIRNDPYCFYCPGVADSAEHTFFDCQRWSEIRLRWREEKEVPQRRSGEIRRNGGISCRSSVEGAWYCEVMLTRSRSIIRYKRGEGFSE